MSHTSQQISGLDTKGRHLLSVIAKRTYRIHPDGSCLLHEEQDGIVEDHIMSDEVEGLFERDIDVYPFKPLTDIVLKGVARSSEKVKRFSASIEIGKLAMDYALFADRKVYRTERGDFAFSEEAKTDEVPLSYTHAYGGMDLNAEKPLRDALEETTSLKYSCEILDILAGSPYRYPRNPLGKGYIVESSQEAVEALSLPNIENPNQLLTPENLICKEVLQWYDMPVPVGTDWVHPGWFPRVAYFGNYTLPEGLDDQIYEIKKRLASEAILNSEPGPKTGAFDFRACNGASLGLQSKHLTGGQTCRLTNIHPLKKDFAFKIPREIPTIKVDGRNGKLKKTDPVIQTLLIEPELNKLTLVWRGSGRALRPYMPEELEAMPFEVSYP